MSDQLSSSALRVQAFLSEHGKGFRVQELPDSTRTAKDAANAIGCTVSQIAKSLVFKDKKTGEAVLVVASGTNRVCATKVEEATGIVLMKADAEYVREKVGYAIGGVPPVAHRESVRTLLDPALKKYPTIWAAAGTPNAVFELKAADLETLTNGQWVDIAE